MSRKPVLAEEQLSAEVREIQKAAAVLACIRCAAEYENEVSADLANAVTVVRAMLTTVAARIVTGSPKAGKADA